jgi:G3E family GTPase
MKVPVHIISGFLGSGKTTAIIKLLGRNSSNEEWAVIINEFGKVSIDSQTLRSTSTAGMVFDVSGGCICCSAKGYFQENLEKIVHSGNYSRIIIEPSGLGGIDMVSEIVGSNPQLRLMPVICLVDLVCIENKRLQMNPVYRTQISKADIIVFSKCDLLEDTAKQDKLIEKFWSIFPEKQNSLFFAGPDFPFPLPEIEENEKISEIKFRMAFAGNTKLTDDNYQKSNYTYDKEVVFDADKLATVFNDHTSVLRAKGHIKTNNGWNLFNFTLSGFMFELCEGKSQNELIVITEKSGPDPFQSLKAKIEEAIVPNRCKNINCS